jgi:hypothetical protein
MEALARNPEQCRAMGVAGRRKIEELFDSEKNADVLVTLFRSGCCDPGADAEATRHISSSPGHVPSMTSHALTGPLPGDG